MQPLLTQIVAAVGRVLLGKEQQVKLAVACLIGKGHLLLEDLPGMGKTTLAHCLANTLGLQYQRIKTISQACTIKRLQFEYNYGETNKYQ